jgi:hypothetical protein
MNQVDKKLKQHRIQFSSINQVQLHGYISYHFRYAHPHAMASGILALGNGKCSVCETDQIRRVYRTFTLPDIFVKEQ